MLHCDSLKNLAVKRKKKSTVFIDLNIDIDKTFLEILISKFNCKLVFKFFSHYPQTQMNLIMKTFKKYLNRVD